MEDALQGMAAIVATIVTVIIIGAIYFAPYIHAKRRHHRQTAAIGVLNVLLGWTFIGWVIALVWANTSDIDPYPPEKVKLKWWQY